MAFLGAYENCGIQTFDDGHQIYTLRRIERYSHFIERLIIEYKKERGPKQAKISIENIETTPVVSILEKSTCKYTDLLTDTIKFLYP